MTQGAQAFQGYLAPSNNDAPLESDVVDHIRHTLAKDQFSATEMDRYLALAMTVRDRLADQWSKTSQTYHQEDVKRVYYLSLEYLLGRSFANNVINLGLEGPVRDAVKSLGMTWEQVVGLEHDAGLGNGGLGRLAACFIDSMATLGLPGYGYGIRYDYGIFRQEIRDGWQVEQPDNWLKFVCPWEIERSEIRVPVQFGGYVAEEPDPATGQSRRRWIAEQSVIGVPYDYPVVGYRNGTVNTLRLWSARALEEFDFQFFNNGEYVRSYEKRIASEYISKVLYPNDNIDQGKELRLKQQYFFVACSLQDIVRRYKGDHGDLRQFAAKNAIQLNDTHPALTVAELMRILLDIENLDWDEAWRITQATCAYTNHTLLPEALERWPVRLIERLLPRHIEIIREIDSRLKKLVVAKFPGDNARSERMAIVESGDDAHVRMAHLAVVGSHTTNGVADLHTELLKGTLFKDFNEMWPERFQSKTNGITQRRWLVACNPELSSLITSKIGDGLATDLYQLKNLEQYAGDKQFLQDLLNVKAEKKRQLAQYIETQAGIHVDSSWIFDVQIKRLHEYKRQFLKALHVVHRYLELKDNPDLDVPPRIVIFGAKAAPGYITAKLVIKLINNIASLVNGDPQTNQKLKCVFLPNYGVSLAEMIIPAADISEQISTAGKEAAGTANMKFALNGAVTVGTYDGANIEIREQVGEDNFILFGARVEEIERVRAEGSYDPYAVYDSNPSIKRVIDYLLNDALEQGDYQLFRPLVDDLLSGGDRWMVLYDFASYLDAQARSDQLFQDRETWAKMCLMNIANTGIFSSDRTIDQYARDIWNVQPVKISQA
jgi:glycogen phosphorylase